MSQNSIDIEATHIDGEYIEEYVPGFADFSEYIASDYSLSIYRKFGVLGARNLLYLQTELHELEAILRGFDEEDKIELAETTDKEKQRYIECGVKTWEDLREQAEGGDERQAEKLAVIHKIRVLMKEYEEALLRRNEVLKLETPEREPFEAFKSWFRVDPPRLMGIGYHTLDVENDMIALGTQVEPDRMSSLLHRCLGYRLRAERKTPKSWGPMYYYPVHRVTLIFATLSMLCSASLLVGAIMALYFVKPIGIRLGIVGIFTLLFAASIALLTHARRVEVYGASAA
ncbi:hypothetical protein ACEPPN_016748 [Leptodophora sp. 'Broadleaf-Isolate-01']